MKRLLLTALFLFIPTAQDAPSDIKAHDLGFDNSSEILWLARVVYSETKKPSEMEAVAWVVRNRVQTGYRGGSYKEVANSPWQFSGLMPSDPNYEHNISREFGDPNFENAARVATRVFFADGEDRPFPKTVRHFYSPHVMDAPDWARGQKPYLAMADRFELYNNVN